MFQKNEISVKNNIPLFATLLLLTIGAWLIWHQDSFYPNIMDWDIFAHQTLFNQLAEGNWYLLPSKISDTFLLDTYLPVFAVLLGLGKIFFPFLSLPGYYFVLSSLHFLSTVALSVFFAWIISKDRLTAMVSGIFGALVFESVVAQTAFFLTPQSLAATLVILSLIFWLEEQKVKSLLLLIFTTVLHLTIGGLGCLLLGMVWSLNEFRKISSRMVHQAALISGLLFVIFAILSNYFPLKFNPFGTPESMRFNFSLNDKFQLIRQWYGYLWLFYPVGLIQTWRTENSKTKTTAFLSLGLLGFAFLPVSYSLKIYTVGRYFIHLIMASGVVAIICQFSRSWVKGTLLALLLIIQISVFYFNQADFKKAIAYGEIATTASQAEWEAAQFLRQSYGADDSVLLVSDPATQQVLEGLSGINSQGGAFASQKTRSLVDATFPETNPEKIKKLLIQVKDNLSKHFPSKVVFIVSGRYLAWQNLPSEKRYDVGYNIWGAKDLTPEGLRFAQFLKESSGFREVFRNKAMVIFEIERE